MINYNVNYLLTDTDKFHNHQRLSINLITRKIIEPLSLGHNYIL